MENEKKETKKLKLSKRHIIFISVVVGILAIGWIINESRYVSTDDAYVEGHSIQVISKVTGHIDEMFVEDNQFVKEGDLLAKIDETDYLVRQEQAAAAYNSALYKQKNAKANFSAVESQIMLAKRNLDRYTKLYEKGAVSKLEYDMAKTKYDEAQAAFTQAEENILSSSGNRVADADLKQLRALKKQADLNVGYTKIYAKQSGYVTNKSVVSGAFVQAGEPLFAIVVKDVWVVANFKENQLKNMKIGQEVNIKVDTYPNKIFKGKIDSIQQRSGAKSSLFPPENAVGSFVKIVQRIPVKIVFTEEIPKNYNIITGMSVIPKVKVK